MRIQFLMLTAFWLGQFSSAPMAQTEVSKELDKLFTHYKSLNKFNGVVLVAKGDKVLLNNGYGLRNAEENKVNDPNSIFQIYSITKTFTSTMVLKLAGEGKLSLDDKLSKFYPAFPNGDKITIEHLLTHTSGINDNSNEEDLLPTESSRVEQFAKNKPWFAPGEGWAYCNGGYQLLGYIIAKVTGMSYEKAIRKYFFEPLQMFHSGFDYRGLNDTRKTIGYSLFTNERKQAAVLVDSTGPFSAGSIYSTAGDLYKYYHAIAAGKILTPGQKKIAFAPAKTNENYAHGWMLNDRIFKAEVIGHSGGAAGFRSYFAMVPAENICVIILDNRENANVEFLAEHVFSILAGKKFEPVKELKLSYAALNKYTGSFYIDEPMKTVIYASIIDGRLAIEVPGQGKTTVLATNANTFVHEEAKVQLKFLNDSTIQVEQRGQTLAGKRVRSFWGLAGSATSKGWTDSIQDIRFTEDKNRKGVWTLSHINLKTGEIKFRLDNNWNINFGDKGADGILDLFGPNIKVESGVYDITLDLSDEAKPRYGILKK